MTGQNTSLSDFFPRLFNLDKLPFQTDTKHSRVNLSNMTVVENRATLLGSTSWNGATDYKTSNEFHRRATAFFAAVKWDVLISLSSSLRNSIPCEFGEKFSISHFNMVQRIVFKDGIS